MTDELMKRARELLALRDRATPGPWEADLDSRYVWTAGMEKCVNASGYDGETLTAADAQFIRAAHDMADTIRDLLSALEYARESWHLANAVAELAMKHRDVAEAEVERLTIREAALSDATVVVSGLRADCSQMVANRVADLAAEVERLRGIAPEFGPRPPHGNDASYQHPALPRYGIRWNGPTSPLAVPMDDGYWTPFHLALAEVERVSALLRWETAGRIHDRASADAAEAKLRERASEKQVGFGVKYSYGHCADRRQVGGCIRHNLHCGYPDCDRRPEMPS